MSLSRQSLVARLSLVGGVAIALLSSAVGTAHAAQPSVSQPSPKPAAKLHNDRPRIVAFGRYVGGHAHPGSRSLHVQSRVLDPDVGRNGRPFISRPITSTSSSDGAHLEDRTLDEPGAASYGAPGEELRTAYVRVGLLSIGISPWQRIEPRGLKNLENARNKWLADRGYTGGVRTVVNDAHHAQHDAASSHGAAQGAAEQADALTAAPHQQPHQPSAAPANTIEPRATFRVQPETPRFRKRMQVRSPFGSGDWVLAPTQTKQRATVGPSVVTVRGDGPASRSAGVTLVLPANTSAREAIRSASVQTQPATTLTAPQAAQVMTTTPRQDIKPADAIEPATTG